MPSDVATRIAELHDDGRTLMDIAELLPAEGVPTARGGKRWWPSTVSSVLSRTAAARAS